MDLGYVHILFIYGSWVNIKQPDTLTTHIRLPFFTFNITVLITVLYI